MSARKKKARGKLDQYLLRHLMGTKGLTREEAEARLQAMNAVGSKLKSSQRVRERKEEIRQQRSSPTARIDHGSRPVPGGATGLKQQR